MLLRCYCNLFILASWLTVNLLLCFLPHPPPSLSRAAPSSTAYPWWSTRLTARVHPASTRHPSGETPPGTGCPQLLEHLYPEARPRRALTACSANRSSSSTRRLSREAHPLIGSCQMDPGKLVFLSPHIVLLLPFASGQSCAYELKNNRKRSSLAFTPFQTG